MNPESKLDFTKIKDLIRWLGQGDFRTRLQTKVGDNPHNVDEALNLIESLCDRIRQRESLPERRCTCEGF